MSEVYYAFVQNNRVKHIAVFENKNDVLANQIVVEQEYDKAVYLADKIVPMFATYDGKTFLPPTLEYLIEIGIVQPSSTEE